MTGTRILAETLHLTLTRLRGLGINLRRYEWDTPNSVISFGKRRLSHITPNYNSNVSVSISNSGSPHVSLISVSNWDSQLCSFGAVKLGTPYITRSHSLPVLSSFQRPHRIMKIVLFQCIMSVSTFEWNLPVYKQNEKPWYTAWFDTEPNLDHRALKFIRWSLRLGWMGHYRTIRGFSNHFSSCLKYRRSSAFNTVLNFSTIFMLFPRVEFFESDFLVKNDVALHQKFRLFDQVHFEPLMFYYHFAEYLKFCHVSRSKMKSREDLFYRVA